MYTQCIEEEKKKSTGKERDFYVDEHVHVNGRKKNAP